MQPYSKLVDDNEPEEAIPMRIEQLIKQPIRLPRAVSIKQLVPYSNIYRYHNLKEEIISMISDRKPPAQLLMGLADKLLSYFQQDLSVMSKN